MGRNKPKEIRYDLLGAKVVENLQKRHFDAYYCQTKEDALKKAIELIPENDVVSWGGSVSIDEIGLLNYVKENRKVIDRDSAKSPEERASLMRQALLCDTFLMSTNAMTEDGVLVNIDGNGNRVAALCYGPKSVVMIVGVNKVCKTLDDAISRARNIAAPINIQRFNDLKTPCYLKGACANCKSTESICNQVVITRMSRPVSKIKIVVVGEDLGF